MYMTYHYLGEYPDEMLREITVVTKQKEKFVFYDGKHLHSEKNQEETAEDTALRLLERVGARSITLTPVNIYARKGGGKKSLGMLYLADIKSTEPGLWSLALLEDEREEIHFLAYVQDHLHPKSETAELWDLYDSHRRFMGKTHPRGVLIPEGCYHIVVHIWIQNTDGRFFLTKRSINKSYAEMWECSGGSAMAGEDSRMAAMREVKEETGIILMPENGRLLQSIQRTNDFLDIWLFHAEVDMEKICLQDRETCGARLVDAEALFTMREREELVPYSYLNELFQHKAKA